MPDGSIEEVLKIFFPPLASPEWRKMASKEIKGKDPFEILAWRGKDELLFLPYYDAQDVAKVNVLNTTRSPASESSLSKPKRWISLPQVNTADVDKANARALEHLSSGAEGSFFHILNAEHTDLHALLQNIQWPYCFLAFHIGDDTFASVLERFLRNQYDPASLNGALFWESIPKKNIPEFYIERCANVKALGVVIPASTPVTEISEALVRGVALWETYSATHDPLKVLRSIAFSLSVDQGIPETTAKLRALRILWAHVVHAYGIHDYKAEALHIHARSVSVDDDQYAPHENMLKGTYSAIAAVLGGCDSLTVIPVESPIGTRWARNVSAILREESFFGSVSDPVSGSYALDVMTSDIAGKAWQIFQRQMSKAS